MPSELGTRELPKGEAAFYSSGNVLAVKYRSAKDSARKKPKTVSLVSTAHSAEMRNTNVRDAEGKETLLHSLIQCENGGS